jgi:RNA polymerase sigma-70 factor (ECF subfamily)
MNEVSKESEYDAAAALVARVRAGDTAAETDIVRRYQRGLRFLLRRRTGSEDLADDLLQETWIVALRKIRDGEVGEPERLAGFLCGIAKNLALGDARKSFRRQTTANSDYIDRAPDGVPGVFEQVSRAEACTFVRRMLAELNVERDREILRRFYVDEEDKDRICDDLQIDGPHFNRVIFRAKARLKEAILRSQGRGSLQLVDH